MTPDRHQRQSLLQQVGPDGQARLRRAHAVVIGCGALGTVSAEYLVRAGVGRVTVVDRDVVELTNLQRQTLFDEADALAGTPKAVAAAARLRDIDSGAAVEAVVADVHQANVEALVGVVGNGPRADVVLDGTDNAETRYLLNDVAVKHGVPWVYAGAVGTEGRAMAIDPPRSACLRCVFPTPPAPGELPTCDAAGVLGPAAGLAASMQAAAALRLLVGDGAAGELVSFDAWTLRARSVSVRDAKRPDCPACGARRFDFLTAPSPASVALCGRDSVQLRPREGVRLDLAEVARSLASTGVVERSPYLVRYAPAEGGYRLTVFADGRTIVHGVTDAGRARALAARAVSA